VRHLLLLPVVLSALALGAHLLREGRPGFALAAAALPLLLAVRHSAALRLVQVLLLVGAIEWLRTLDRIVDLRRAEGQPWHRLVVILGTVALVTGLAVPAAGRWFRGRAPRHDLAEPETAP